MDEISTGAGPATPQRLDLRALRDDVLQGQALPASTVLALIDALLDVPPAPRFPEGAVHALATAGKILQRSSSANDISPGRAGELADQLAEIGATIAALVTPPARPNDLTEQETFEAWLKQIGADQAPIWDAMDHLPINPANRERWHGWFARAVCRYTTLGAPGTPAIGSLLACTDAAEALPLADEIESSMPGRIEWQVLNRDETGCCMVFTRDDDLDPKRACERWLAEKRAERPGWIEENGYHAVEVRTHTRDQRLALRAAGILRSAVASGVRLSAAVADIRSERDAFLAQVPECPEHGPRCVEHGLEWIRKARSVIDRLKQLVAGAEQQRSCRGTDSLPPH